MNISVKGFFMNDLVQRLEQGKSVVGIRMLLPIRHDSECYALVRVKGFAPSGSSVLVEVAPIDGEGSTVVSPSDLVDNKPDALKQRRLKKQSTLMQRDIRRKPWAKERREAVAAAFDALSASKKKIILEEMAANGLSSFEFRKLSEGSAMRYLDKICDLTFGVVAPPSEN